MNHIHTHRTVASRRAALLVASGLAAFSGIAAASAASADTFASDVGAISSADASALHVVVRYDGQSLSTDYGAQSLYRRIVFAARQVCPDDSGSRDLRRQQLAQECRRQAVEGAIQQVHNVRLAAVYSAHSKDRSAS